MNLNVSETLVVDSNYLIAGLTHNTKAELIDCARIENFSKGQIIGNQGQPLDSVYFILSGLIISIFEGTDGTGIANGMRGPEAAYGAIGTGRRTAKQSTVGTGRVFAQIPTTALVIPTADFSRVLMKSNDLLRIILSHAAEVVRSHELTLNCSRHHRIDNRLAHLLSTLTFYNESSEIPTTHSELGEVLGVRRESISTALAEYERKNIVRVSRGRVSVLDSGILERYSCDCHQELIELRLRKATGPVVWEKDSC